MGAPVTVAVVSYETRELLDRCLAALAPTGAEIWVVDNASRDGSAQMVRERHPRAHLVASGANLGFGAAVNLVAERAPRTPWLLIANADTELEPGALEALLAAGEADPGAGVLAPRLVLPDGRTQHSLHPFPTLAFTLAFNLGLGARSRRWGDRMCLEGSWDPERPRRAPWAIGALLLVRREAWEAAGGFDPAQWLYAEDLDLGWRVAQAGWATRYVPEARVRHAESAAIGAVWGDAKTARWMAATYDWMHRRRGPLLTRLVALVNVVGAGARWVALRARRRPEAATYAGWARLPALGLLPPRRLARRLPRPPA